MTASERVSQTFKQPATKGHVFAMVGLVGTVITCLLLILNFALGSQEKVTTIADKEIKSHNESAVSHVDIRKQVYSNSVLLNEVAQNSKVQTEILKRMEANIKEIKDGR